MSGLLLLAFAIAAQEGPRNPRDWAGDWYVSDTTDNNSGERQVYAFQTYLTRPDYVTLTLRCSQGEPTFFVDWTDLALPEVAVFSIAAPAESHGEVERYVFDKSQELTERGYRASAEVSRRIVAAIGNAANITLTAHPSYGDKTLIIDVAGTQQAWSRVVRHCPAPIMPLPPL